MRASSRWRASSSVFNSSRTGCGSSSRPRCSLIEGLGRFLGDLGDPCGDVGACDRLRLEAGIAAGSAQCEVQLAGAPPERGHQLEEGAVHVLGQRVGGERAVLIEEVLEVLQRVGPAVPLIGYVALQQGQCDRGAVGGRVLERAGDRNAVA